MHPVTGQLPFASLAGLHEGELFLQLTQVGPHSDEFRIIRCQIALHDLQLHFVRTDLCLNHSRRLNGRFTLSFKLHRFVFGLKLLHYLFGLRQIDLGLNQAFLDENPILARFRHI